MNNTNKVKIYSLVDPRNNRIMYIGRTKARLSARLAGHCHDSRHKNGPKDKWIRELNDLKLKPIISMIEDVEEEIWREREIYWIAFYRQLNSTLCNLAKGGEGPCGLKRTEEYLLSMSERKSKPVYQLTLNFKIVKLHKSCRLASLEIGIADTNISRCAKEMGKYSCKGFIWIYEKDYLLWQSTETRINYTKNNGKKSRKVKQYTKNMKLVKEWNSIKELCKELSMNRIGILRARKQKKYYKNFFWI